MKNREKERSGKKDGRPGLNIAETGERKRTNKQTREEGSSEK
jgi:hypothetical protein